MNSLVLCNTVPTGNTCARVAKHGSISCLATITQAKCTLGQSLPKGAQNFVTAHNPCTVASQEASLSPFGAFGCPAVIAVIIPCGSRNLQLSSLPYSVVLWDVYFVNW